MKNIKKDIPTILGLLATTSLAVVAGGLVNPLLSSVGSNIGAGLAANFIGKITPEKIKRWFINIHPNNLNHSIKKLFIESVKEAMENILVLFSETQASEIEKKEARKFIKTLQKRLPAMLLNDEQIKLDDPEIKYFLYEKSKEDVVCGFIEKHFASFEISDSFKSFLAQNLSAQIQLCFGEGLKNPIHRNAWIAFQRMLMEEIRNDIKQIADTQQSIKDDLSDLKFTKTGLSETQIAEIRQLINLLNDKKLIEIKISDGINQCLKSIEDKANEIIRITTKTQLTVDELKHIIEKINRQNRTTHFIMSILVGCLLAAGYFTVYKIINQPFTTTVAVFGWEGEQHNPLNGTGAIVLTLGDKIEKAEINRQGEAVFKGVLPEYNGQTVAAHITDTEGELYYLADSIVKIEKNGITKVQVLLHGLEKLEGAVYDDISGEGLPDVSVTIAGITVTTDEKGNFIIAIPIEKQRSEQEIEISKANYKSKRQTIPMSGENKYRTVLERE